MGEEEASFHPKHLIPMWWDLMKDEWRSRTAFGKMLYPLWLGNATIMWTLALTVVVFALVVRGANEGVDLVVGAAQKIAPEVHRRE